jgi:lipopolysaccharide/colanic/teichoic acid biosynthesis glycosyltransferase
MLDTNDRANNSSRTSIMTSERNAVNEELFHRMIAVERNRAERSGIPFALMLIEITNHHGSAKKATMVNAMSALLPSIRESDVIGWYRHETVVGVMFTGLTVQDKHSILNTILTRVSSILQDKMAFDQFNQLAISLYWYPDDWDHDIPGRPCNMALYPDLSSRENTRRILLGAKRIVDIVGSLFALTLCSPLLLMIAIAIKVTSKGPILFRQKRVGKYGRCFTFLKFRSMESNNDSSAHREYVKQLIAGRAKCEQRNGKGEEVYKLANDKRITRIGRVLRRTSLDELPQFLNVLKGEMSLVGPRPAIPYEVDSYQPWHRRRILECKPGITGLWQVNGRNRVKFDDMVRLDLQYASRWSLWRDIKILLRTPRAVLRGAH